MDFNRYREVVLPVYSKFVDKCAWKFFGGSFPRNVSPEIIAVAILEAAPLFSDASTEVRENCLAHLRVFIQYRMIEQDAADVMNGAEWLS
jgi:hypothetical protein